MTFVVVNAAVELEEPVDLLTCGSVEVEEPVDLPGIQNSHPNTAALNLSVLIATGNLALHGMVTSAKRRARYFQQKHPTQENQSRGFELHSQSAGADAWRFLRGGFSLFGAYVPAGIEWSHLLATIALR
eukprot:1267253-Amphidinium_carterae.1